MTAPMDTFSFPPSFDIKSLPSLEKKVCVVTIIGKNRLSGFTTKASILNPVLDRDVFLGSESCVGKQIDRGEIECYYDTDAQVIYLHYQSLSDASKLASKCKQLVDKSMDLISLWQDEDFMYAKSLLFLFCVSHIVLLSHPGSTFDISYVKLFRTLDTVRSKLQPFMTDALHGLPIPKDWLEGARPCSPRVLFIFGTPTVDVGYDDGESLGLSRSRSQRTPPIKKLQHNIEDQIYRIFRKSRIITNISNNSLFAVPANQEFVFVNCRSSEVADPVGMYLQQLKSYSVSGKDSESPKSRSYLTNRRFNHGVGSGDGPRSPISSRSSEQSFKEFLLQHIELAFVKGFDDNVGRNPLRSVFEMVSCEVWFSVATTLHKFFFTDTPEVKVQTHFNLLGSLISTDVRFSENRCNKILPLAENAYQQDLPQHYITEYHYSKLAQAKRVFAQFARGPAYEKYLKQLEESCEEWWKSGHRQCEETSLTGNLCLNHLHRLPEDGENDENNHLPVMTHSSQIKTKAACNCGQKQADKDDPFDHKYANFGFYQTLEESCCGKLKHVEFPVFNPSTSDVRAGQVSSTPHTKLSARDSGKLDMTAPITSSLSLALSLGQSGGSDLYGHRSPSSPNPEQSEMLETSQTATVTESVISDTEIHHSAFRQHSTTEYLPGMIHSESPGGLLPLFPSWSLCCIGKSTLYSHIHGFDLPGFLAGSNFLLPWDITLQAVKEKWPTVGETAGKKGRQRRVPQKEIGEVTVRAFLGMEYECPRGHRFFCSGPEKIIKVSSASTVKDNATKLLSLDMPLYCPCHCSTKGYIAQLMRVYIVTPESSVKIMLKPVVQPSISSSPLFEPGNDGPLELSQGSVWVLRLPHVYLGDNGVYTMPTDPQHLHACRLLKGMFSYKEA
ncbi:protein smg8-like isoform X2 [Gigantopelta aegis]|uniref:protein smg8-like isoform X2 n=1 Tax=Gigantopelta aegis TaxID=1735272 RepID=UPI001B88AD93|nr:protein smg8-like isoform X2 [Gigantopelta aegis]